MTSTWITNAFFYIQCVFMHIPGSCHFLDFNVYQLVGRTGVVVSVADYGPSGPLFETWPRHSLLWPGASHIYPLLSTGLTQEAVDGRLGLTVTMLETTLCLMCKGPCLQT